MLLAATGTLVALAGAITYFTYFAQFAPVRDFPWINLPMVLLGWALSGVAVYHAFRGPFGLLQRALTLVAFALGLALSGLFVSYIFVISYQLPDPTQALAVGEQAPDFALQDADGRLVRLSDFRGKKIVLTFYRGYW